MPRLGVLNQSKIKLPSTLGSDDEAWVVIQDKVLVSQVAEAAAFDTEIDRRIFTVSKMVTEWNFADENGQVIPITLDSVKQLEVIDFNFIMDNINAMIDEKSEGLDTTEKKASPSGSEPEGPEDQTPTSQQITVNTVG